MKAAVLTAPRRIRVQEGAVPSLGVDEVCIAVTGCGICGSDLHEYKHGPLFWLPTGVGGHEFGGVVLAKGQAVRHIDVDQPVVFRLVDPCGNCRFCRSALSQHCPRSFTAPLPKGGGFAQYAVVSSGRAVPVPAEFPLHLAPLVDPLATVIHAEKKIGASGDLPGMVVGSGPIALLLTRWLLSKGYRNITLVLKHDGIKTSLRGSCDLVDIRSEQPNPVPRFEYAVDCAGTSSSFALAFHSLLPGGRLVELGIHDSSPPLDLTDLMFRETKIEGSFLYSPDDFQRALDAIQNVTLNVADLITATMPLSEISDAFERLVDNRGGHIKIAIDPRLH